MALACLACISLKNSTDSFRLEDGSFREKDMPVTSAAKADRSRGPDCFSTKQASSSAERNFSSPEGKTVPEGQPRSGVMLEPTVFHPEPCLTRCNAVGYKFDDFNWQSIGCIERKAALR